MPWEESPGFQGPRSFPIGNDDIRPGRLIGRGDIADHGACLAEESMLYQYPLETLARRRATTSQIEFARAARRVLPDTDDALFEAHDHGLAIFVANEDALAAPVRVLRELYGDFVEVRRPKVRCVPGNPPHEPIMHVRVTTRLDRAPAVVSELRARDIRVLERCIRGRIEIVRGEGPLASLLGFPKKLAALTDDTATHDIRLVRYAPVRTLPPPAA
jgi:hypothetical protein